MSGLVLFFVCLPLITIHSYLDDQISGNSLGILWRLRRFMIEDYVYRRLQVELDYKEADF